MASSRVPFRTTRRVGFARAAAVATAVLSAVGLLTSRPGGVNDPAQTALLAATAATFGAVGAVLIGRLPRHPVAWLLLWGGAWTAVGIGAGGLADYGLVVHPGSVPGAVWLAWVSQWSWAPYIGAFVLLPIYFPTGSPPGPRWQLAGALGVAFILVGFAESALSPWSPDPYPVRNPTELPGHFGAAIAVLDAVAYALTISTMALAVLSVVVRYRRSSAVEAAQLRWFASAAVLGLVSGVLATSISTVAPSTPAWQAAGYLTGLVSFVGVLLVPIAIGIAILRYRLYDIDRIVSRTIGWAIVTAVLASVFVTVVVGLETLLAGFTRDQTLAIVASTLVAFALFQPLRRRVQRAVDRRFYRASYDGQQTVDRYVRRLRDQGSLGEIEGLTVLTVRSTVRPAHVSVWLRRRAR